MAKRIVASARIGKYRRFSRTFMLCSPSAGRVENVEKDYEKVHRLYFIKVHRLYS
jgi:hypothetical protein